MKKQLLKKFGLAFLGTIGVFSVANAQHWLASISGPVPLFNGDYLGKRLAVDGAGNTYTTGTYGSSSNANNKWVSAYDTGKTGSTGTSVITATNTGAATNKWNSFVAKTDKYGVFEWMIGMGSSNTIDSTITNAIAVDDIGTGAVYAGGRFNKQINSFSGAPTSSVSTFTGIALTTTGGYDGFLVKLTKDGEYQWHKTFSGTGDEQVRDVTTDPAGNLIVAGTFEGNLKINGAPIVIDGVTIDVSSKGATDGFIAKFDTNGNLKFIISIGGIGADNAYSVTTDINNNIYATGSAAFGSTRTISVGNYDFTTGIGTGVHTWLGKFDVNNGNVLWAKAVLSSSNQQQIAYDIAIDKETEVENRGVYIVGTLAAGSATIDFAGVEMSSGNTFASPFFAKFNAYNGTGIWANFFHTGAASTASVITVNDNKEVFAGGAVVTSINFGTGNIANAGTHAYIVKLNNSNDINGGTALDHKIIKSAANTNNTNVDRVMGLVATNSAVYVAGQASGSAINTATPNFAGIAGADFYYRGGSWNAFVMKWGATSLPVSLTEFKGNRTSLGNLLSWTTLSETDNKYFELERSSDGVNFSFLKRVSGAGTSTEKLSYSYLDTESLTGVNYYRLKQVDKDGAFSYAENIVAINSQLSTGELKLYPNPGLGVVNVQLPSEVLGAEINVYNQTGKLVKSYSNVSGDSHAVDISEQAAGVYFIQVIQKGKSDFIKYIKQ